VHCVGIDFVHSLCLAQCGESVTSYGDASFLDWVVFDEFLLVHYTPQTRQLTAKGALVITSPWCDPMFPLIVQAATPLWSIKHPLLTATA